MNQLPKDPVILLSYINTQLRDFYPSLDELCSDKEIEQNLITEPLKKINYEYDQEKNQFV